MTIFIKLLLFPFSILYGIVLRLRNALYDWGIFTSTEFNYPLIVVGNLSVGGTGKTPHTELIINYLRKDQLVASLSRGYGRKTEGFKIADTMDTPESIGDEPYQIYSKFSNIIVAVDEKRKRGINHLRALSNKPSVIVLDDAFQHRQVKAGLNILLTDYNKLYSRDCLLPAGRLREYRTAAKRANIIIVSKCPKVLSPIDQKRCIDSLKPKASQKIYFSYICYEKLVPLNESARQLALQNQDLRTEDCLLFTAIANPKPLANHLGQLFSRVESLEFKDHHFFQDKDYQKIIKKSEKKQANKLIFVCSEKDAVKINVAKFEDRPLFTVPIEIELHYNQTEEFLTHITKYVKSYPRNS